MNDISLMSIDDIMIELESRCHTCVFIAKVNDSDDNRHQKYMKGCESDILGMLEWYKMVAHGHLLQEMLKPDEDGDEWKNK